MKEKEVDRNGSRLGWNKWLRHNTVCGQQTTMLDLNTPPTAQDDGGHQTERNRHRHALQRTFGLQKMRQKCGYGKHVGNKRWDKGVDKTNLWATKDETKVWTKRTSGQQKMRQKCGYSKHLGNKRWDRGVDTANIWATKYETEVWIQRTSGQQKITQRHGQRQDVRHQPNKWHWPRTATSVSRPACSELRSAWPSAPKSVDTKKDQHHHSSLNHSSLSRQPTHWDDHSSLSLQPTHWEDQGHCVPTVFSFNTSAEGTKQPEAGREEEWASYWILTSCQPHRVTSGWPNSIISKCTVQNSSHNYV